ncbi:MAG TPA: hypothetical protein VFZ79_03645 [Acidimicrobiales bacterium]
MDDEAVDHGVVRTRVHVEVHDVGAAGRQVTGQRGQVARPVGQLHPELVSSHVSCVPRRSSPAPATMGGNGCRRRNGAGPPREHHLSRR